MVIMVFGMAGCSSEEQPLRLHIRANSNLEADQRVKLMVRDEVVGFLSPLLQDAKCVADAKKIIKNNTDKIEKLCNDTLKSKGFFYGAKLQIKEEYFPTRNYGNLTLEGGIYDAVIINLGEGKGDNWWCVAYPPLCFGESDDIEYRSKIWDLIDSWGKNE